MTDVVVQVPDYDALTNVNTIRRLYCPVGRRLNSHEYHVLNKRISKACILFSSSVACS